MVILCIFDEKGEIILLRKFYFYILINGRNSKERS